MIPNNYILQHNTIPSQGKLMAIDVGTRRIGIADCDYTQTITTPRLIIERQSNIKDFALIKNFITENDIKALIIGFPAHMDRKFHEMSEFTIKFTKSFDQFLSQQGLILPIILFDERLSSFEAEEIAKATPTRKKQKHFDDIAARVILEDFLYCKG